MDQSVSNGLTICMVNQTVSADDAASREAVADGTPAAICCQISEAIEFREHTQLVIVSYDLTSSIVF